MAQNCYCIQEIHTQTVCYQPDSKANRPVMAASRVREKNWKLALKEQGKVKSTTTTVDQLDLSVDNLLVLRYVFHFRNPENGKQSIRSWAKWSEWVADNEMSWNWNEIILTKILSNVKILDFLKTMCSTFCLRQNKYLKFLLFENLWHQISISSTFQAANYRFFYWMFKNGRGRVTPPLKGIEKFSDSDRDKNYPLG